MNVGYRHIKLLEDFIQVFGHLAKCKNASAKNTGHRSVKVTRYGKIKNVMNARKQTDLRCTTMRFLAIWTYEAYSYNSNNNINTKNKSEMYETIQCYETKLFPIFGFVQRDVWSTVAVGQMQWIVRCFAFLQVTLATNRRSWALPAVHGLPHLRQGGNDNCSVLSKLAQDRNVHTPRNEK